MDYDYSDVKKQICVLIGAGMSAGAGIPTFRGKGGEWMTEHQVREAFEIEKFKADAELRSILWHWLADSPAWNAKPTRAHWLLKQLDDAGHLVSIMTQNFDMLEKKAGIRQGKIRQLHGRMDRSVCLSCGRYFDTRDIINGLFLPLDRRNASGISSRSTSGQPEVRRSEGVERSEADEVKKLGKLFDPHCPDCGGIIKPDIVFFGEPLDEMMLKYIGGMDIPACDELWCIGTSLLVHPAADIPLHAKSFGKRIVIVSTGKTELDNIADEIIHLPADRAVAVLVNRTINNLSSLS